MVARSMSRGRFDRSSPGASMYESDRLGDRGGGGDRGGERGHFDSLRSMKKQSYTPRGGGAEREGMSAVGRSYSTPRSPRSPGGPSPGVLSRSASRGRLSRAESAQRDDHHYRRGGGDEDYDVDRREPASEGRHHAPYGGGGRSTFGRSASAARERFETPRDDGYDDDDASADGHRSLGGGSSVAHARDVLSKMRVGGGGGGGGMASRFSPGGAMSRGGGGGMDRGTYSEPRPQLRGGISRNVSMSSPRRRLDDDDAMMYDGRDSGVEGATNKASSSSEPPGPSRYEYIGMKEELKKKVNEAADLRNEIVSKDEEAADLRREITMKEGEASELRREVSAKDADIADLRREVAAKDENVSGLRRRIEEMRAEHEEGISEVRSSLVATFKEDMQEMKGEWEDAFQRLKEESDSTQRALEMELHEATQSKAETEGELNDLRAEYRTQMEEERARSAERMEELKRSKEEDLERLRGMYEEHLDGTKKSAASVESELKEEIHMLLEENEKVKLCYENLESELQRFKADLEEVSANYQKSINEGLRWEKDATAYKEELDDLCDEHDKAVRLNKKLDKDLGEAKADLERVTSQHQRSQAERARFEREYNEAARERDEVKSGYNDLLKKLDDIQEERTLEGRYTEALVKQRDNMNAIIESSQREIEELKGMNTELGNVNKSYAALGKEFDLPNSDASTLREELVRAEKMKERLETLGRERERYNATVKALKVDLKALHGGSVGAETSLQEHMRLLNEKWDGNESRLRQMDKLKTELDEAVQLLEENATDRERMLKDHHAKVDSLERSLEEAQTALVKMEREKMAMSDKLSDHEIMDAKMKRIQGELQKQCDQLQERLAYTEDERQQKESQCKSLDSDNRSMQAELEKVRAKKDELEDALDKAEDARKGLKKKWEATYYELEETQRELNSAKQDHAGEIQVYDAELAKLSKQKDVIDEQEEEIKRLKDVIARTRREHAQELEDAQTEAAEQYKVQMRLMEEKHADQDRRNGEYLEQKHRDEVDQLRERSRKLEDAMKEQKESLDQKSMAEIKRRGEFAKQKQELEILRSKERHLETHVNQLEEHISKVVADYEARLQSSNQTICTTVNEETKALKKQVRELEKKLEVSSAAMKQIGKSSLLMEKENERLKQDKNELKLKLRKLVDCAENGMIRMG